MSTAGLIVICLGALLIVVGIGITISEHRNRQSTHPGSETKKTGIAEDLDALDKVLNTIKSSPPGMRLIVLGIVCLIIGAAIGGTDAVAHAVKSATNN